MSLLFRVVYAAHANGTHHKLALDALRHLATPAAEGWRRLVLKHAESYLVGSKLPDNEFKDFKNHVLHVRDGYWGGAVGAVERWYVELVGALKNERWEEAVRAAGILSHYLTDPIHPFHTAQSEAENNIHRAAEWSINRSYDALRMLGEAGAPAIPITVSEGDGWLRDLVCRSAEIANANYERLIAHYDIHRGISDPPAGLDDIARSMVGDLLSYAARANAAVLERAFAEAGVQPPEVALTLDTLLATLKIPRKWVLKKLADAADRRQVEAMYDELKSTGRVEEHLPEDDRAVREAHRAEVLERQAAALAEKRAGIVGKVSPAPTAAAPVAAPGTAARPVVAPATAPAAGAPTNAPPAPPQPVTSRPASVAPAAAVPMKPPAASEAMPHQSVPATPTSSAPAAMQPRPVGPAAPQPAPVASPAQAQASVPTIGRAASERPPGGLSGIARGLTAGSTPAIYLTQSDELEKAPSIGPKTAERFAQLGIKTVADLLAADPAKTAPRLEARHITADVLADWQAQSRLVLSVQGLRGTHAQLLTGAGYRTAEAIARADTDKLCAAVLAYAGSADGQRLLRDGTPPDVARIKSWCEAARRAVAA